MAYGYYNFICSDMRVDFLSMTNERLRQSIEQLTKGCSYCANTGICGWDDTPQFCGECSHGIAALNGWNARIPINALKIVREAAIEDCVNALEADARLCDCAALEDRECACGAWDDYKSITSVRAVEIVLALKGKDQ